MPAAPDSALAAPFGGSAFRDRFTDAIWQGPTWSFAILLVLLDLGDTAGAARVLQLGGFALIMLVTLVAVRVDWARVPPWTQAVVPGADLVGASMMVLAVPLDHASTTLLLASLPVVWLSFEFGRAGLTTSIAVVVAVALTAYLARGGAGRPVLEASIVVPVLFLVGLAVVARLMAGVLDRVGSTLHRRSTALRSALELAESRLVVLNGVMESIDAGVVVLRPGVEPLANTRASELFSRARLDPEQWEAPDALVFLDDGVTPVAAADQAVVRSLAGQEWAGLVQRIGEPGDQVAVVTSSRQLVQADGEVVGSVLAAWDATEMMDAIKVREEFVTTVSHELRTPLTAITSSLELLATLVDTADVDDDCDILLRACRRNAALLGARISELMASTTVESPLRTRSMDVTTLVRAATTKHLAVVDRAGLELRLDVEDGVVAEVDATTFEQVVDNLVSNAVKYTRTGGLTVALHCADDDMVLSVADSGVGMTPEEVRQACDRFYRAPGARATATRGLGIGLGLVKSIVERHDGRLDIVSEPGVGTTVTIAVPRHAPLPVTPAR